MTLIFFQRKLRVHIFRIWKRGRAIFCHSFCWKLKIHFFSIILQNGNFFFRGGFAGVFESVSISSHIRVQITSELVRLIALIRLNMFSIHNVSEKSLKKFFRTRFWRSVLKKWLKITISALSKGFSKVLCIKPKSSHLPLWWMWPSFFHISWSFLRSELWSSLLFQDSI